jgi:hypothetical protein
MKLYRVTLTGMTYSVTGKIYGVSYVVAENTNQAYLKVKEFLDKEDIGFRSERGLKMIELIADEIKYSEVDHLLLL